MVTPSISDEGMRLCIAIFWCQFGLNTLQEYHYKSYNLFFCKVYLLIVMNMS